MEIQEDLIQQWNARSEVVLSNASAGGLTMAPGALELLPIILKLMPTILKLVEAVVSGGFSASLILGLLPEIVKQLFPDLDQGLIDILIKIIETFVKK